MLSCQRCKRSTNGPQAFLLTCRGCSKTWHHRCHMPPVEDAELFQRLRATNDQDMANGIYAWTCRKCKKAVSGTLSPMPGGSGVAFASLEDKKSLDTSGDSPTIKDTTSAPAAGVAPPGVKVEPSAVVDVLDDRERHKISDRKESVDETPIRPTLINKRETMAARKLPHPQAQSDPTESRDTDAEMATQFALQEEKRSLQGLSKTPSRQASDARSVDTVQVLFKTHSHLLARKVVSTDAVRDLSKGPCRQTSGAWNVVNVHTTPPTHSKGDVEMADDTMISTFSKSPAGLIPRVSQTSFSDHQPIGHKSPADSFNKREQEVRTADEAATQPQGNQDDHVDDDPEDLYGPPVERRVIRILPSLAEELREQQRRTAVQKEKKLKRAYLAPDWISAKYANDPLWTRKEVPTAIGRQRPRKVPARKLGENGLNVNELVGCFTVANWVREHIDKTRMYACIP